jgi:hypothetical protein
LGGGIFFVYLSKLKIMINTVDDLIKVLLENLEFAYKLKYEGENEEQDLGSLIDSINDQFK